MALIIQVDSGESPANSSSKTIIKTSNREKTAMEEEINS